MKKFSFKNNKKLKQAGITAITSLVAGLALGAYAYPIVAVAEEQPEPKTVTIDVTIKETQDVYSIALTETENGYTAVCDNDASFDYEVAVSEEMTTVYCAGVYLDNEWTYEMNYSFIETAEGEDNESVLTVTKGVDEVEVTISLETSIVYYDAYLEGEEKADLTATLSEDGTSISVMSQENKVVFASDVMTIKLVALDDLLIEDFEKTMELAESELFPKIYTIVAIIVLIALVVLGIAMLFVAG